MAARRVQRDKLVERRNSMGLSGLTNQVYRKVTKKGFDFTLLVAGEAALGKSTLVRSLFLHETEATDGPQFLREGTVACEMNPTVKITPHVFNIQENGVHLKLTIIDTPGFGEAINSSNSWEPIVDYIDNAFHQYLSDETRVNRKKIDDRRVHCCLYFINPAGRGLKPLDVVALKALHHKVNIIPIIAKSDTLTKSELAVLKEAVMREIEEHNINIFAPMLEDDDEFEDEEDREEAIAINVALAEAMPFAVIGSNTLIKVGGRTVRGRKYPWGVVEVDNPDHCEFQKLRDVLIKTHLQDLKDVTVDILYEEFRKQALESNPTLATSGIDEGLKRGYSELNTSQSELRESEAELMRRHEQMKRDLEEQQRMLEEKKRQFEEERRLYEEASARMKGDSTV